jgi:hypothetical protein
VIATGDLAPDGGVLAVEELLAKLETAVKALRALGGVILFPKSQLPEGDAAARLSPEQWRRLGDSAGRARLAPVGSLADAANVTFHRGAGDAFRPDDLGIQRQRLELLRYSTAKAPELFDAARALFLRALELQPQAPGTTAVKFHALITACLALGSLRVMPQCGVMGEAAGTARPFSTLPWCPR